MKSHAHQYTLPHAWDTHVTCELCGFAIAKRVLLQSSVYSPLLFWEFFGKVWTSIARREVFRTTGCKV